MKQILIFIGLLLTIGVFGQSGRLHRLNEIDTVNTISSKAFTTNRTTLDTSQLNVVSSIVHEATREIALNQFDVTVDSLAQIFALHLRPGERIYYKKRNSVYQVVDTTDFKFEYTPAAAGNLRQSNKFWNTAYDTSFVVPTRNGLYALLMPSKGVLGISEIPDEYSGNTSVSPDAKRFQTAYDYLFWLNFQLRQQTANTLDGRLKFPQANVIFVDEDLENIDSTITARHGIQLKGMRGGNKQYTARITFNLQDSTKYGIILDNMHGSYSNTGGFVDVAMYTVSEMLAPIYLRNPFNTPVSNVQTGVIGSGSMKKGIVIEGGVTEYGIEHNIFGSVDSVGIHFVNKNGLRGTTTAINGGKVFGSAKYGIIVDSFSINDLHLSNFTIEQVDSTSIIVEGNCDFFADHLYFEQASLDSVPLMQFGTKSICPQVQISHSKLRVFGGAGPSPDSSVIVEIGSVTNLSIKDSRTEGKPYLIGTRPGVTGGTNITLDNINTIGLQTHPSEDFQGLLHAVSEVGDVSIRQVFIAELGENGKLRGERNRVVDNNDQPFEMLSHFKLGGNFIHSENTLAYPSTNPILFFGGNYSNRSSLAQFSLFNQSVNNATGVTIDVRQNSDDNIVSLIGLNLAASSYTAANVTQAYALELKHGPSGGATGNTANTRGIRIGRSSGGSGATVNNSNGIEILSQGAANTSVSRGIYIRSQVGSSVNYAVDSEGGDWRLADNMQLTDYGISNKTLGQLSKSFATYAAAYASDGSLVEIPTNWGSFSGTADINGDVTITHNLQSGGSGITPDFIKIQDKSGNNHNLAVISQGTTTFTVRGIDPATGNALISGLLDFFWEAKAKAE